MSTTRRVQTKLEGEEHLPKEQKESNVAKAIFRHRHKKRVLKQIIKSDDGFDTNIRKLASQYHCAYLANLDTSAPSTIDEYIKNQLHYLANEIKCYDSLKKPTEQDHEARAIASKQQNITLATKCDREYEKSKEHGELNYATQENLLFKKLKHLEAAAPLSGENLLNYKETNALFYQTQTRNQTIKLNRKIDECLKKINADKKPSDSNLRKLSNLYSQIADNYREINDYPSQLDAIHYAISHRSKIESLTEEDNEIIEELNEEMQNAIKVQSELSYSFPKL